MDIRFDSSCGLLDIMKGEGHGSPFYGAGTLLRDSLSVSATLWLITSLKINCIFERLALDIKLIILDK